MKNTAHIRPAFAVLSGILTGFLILCIFFNTIYNAEAQTASTVESRRAQLQAELDQVEKEIEAQRKILNTKSSERASLERDVAILNAEIQKSKLSIRARNIAIQQLTADITEKQSTITTMGAQIERQKDSLAEILRKTNDLDSYSLVEAVLAQEQLSEFYGDLETYDTLKDALRQSYTIIDTNRQKTQEQRLALEGKKSEETKLRQLQELQQKKVQEQEAEKKKLVAVTKGQEKEYQKIIQQKEKTAAEIRSALFSLRDSAAIPFGQALDMAVKAGERTGVRPAFILAILTQESNLGENVGTCNRPGDSRTWKDIMPGPNDNSWRDDQTTYLALMAELKMDPNGMPLSCPWGNGWGGAMGPSQFIPTTWKSYKERIGKVTGNVPPSPWNPQDAIAATSLYVADLGADKRTFAAEREAALRYYAGSNWWKSANAFYGDEVMSHAADYQKQIDILNR